MSVGIQLFKEGPGIMCPLVIAIAVEVVAEIPRDIWDSSEKLVGQFRLGKLAK